MNCLRGVPPSRRPLVVLTGTVSFFQTPTVLPPMAQSPQMFPVSLNPPLGSQSHSSHLPWEPWGQDSLTRRGGPQRLDPLSPLQDNSLG